MIDVNSSELEVLEDEVISLKDEISSLKNDFENITSSAIRDFYNIFKSSEFLQQLRIDTLKDVDMGINHRLLKVKDEIVKESADKLFILNKSKFKDISFEVSKLKSQAIDEVNQLFRQGGFLKMFKLDTIRLVEQEVKSKLRNKNIHSLLNDLVVNKLKDNFEDYIEIVADVVVNKIIDKNRSELAIAKELKYTADITIKHILQETGISIEKEKLFLECLQRISNDNFQLSNSKKLNVKKLETKG